MSVTYVEAGISPLAPLSALWLENCYHPRIELSNLLSETHIFIFSRSLVSNIFSTYKTLNRHCRSTWPHHRVVSFPIKTVFSTFAFFLLSFSAFAWLCRLFSLSFFLFSIDFSYFFFYPDLPSVRFINQWFVPLYGSWDQIRFTSGLNVCSHGLLHLKGNSFS